MRQGNLAWNFRSTLSFYAAARELSLRRTRISFMLRSQHTYVVIATWRSRMSHDSWKPSCKEELSRCSIPWKSRQTRASRSCMRRAWPPRALTSSLIVSIGWRRREMRNEAARLCFGQSPAATASALVVAVADIGSWKATTESELAWMRTAGFTREKNRGVRAPGQIRQMVFHSGLVWRVRTSEMDDSARGAFLEDDGHASGGAAGHVQMGDQERVTGVPESDDRGGSAGI